MLFRYIYFTHCTLIFQNITLLRYRYPRYTSTNAINNHQTDRVLTDDCNLSNLILFSLDSDCDEMLKGSNLYPRFEGNIIFITYYRYER
jgi:hypothetical protein